MVGKSRGSLLGGQHDKARKSKKVIKQNYEDAEYGIFFTRNWIGDPMATIYEDKEITIDICYSHSYFEVFGLNDEEEMELAKYYDSLRRTTLS